MGLGYLEKHYRNVSSSSFCEYLYVTVLYEQGSITFSIVGAVRFYLIL